MVHFPISRKDRCTVPVNLDCVAIASVNGLQLFIENLANCRGEGQTLVLEEVVRDGARLDLAAVVDLLACTDELLRELEE